MAVFELHVYKRRSYRREKAFDCAHKNAPDYNAITMGPQILCDECEQRER